MESKYLIDTNIIIYYLRNEIPEKEIEKLETIFENSFNISTITKIEVLGWHKITEKDKEQINFFLNNAKVFYINKSVEKKVIEIKQKHKIKTPDAIIGATALKNKFTIVTRNEKDFNKIDKIKIYNPFK